MRSPLRVHGASLRLLTPTPTPAPAPLDLLLCSSRAGRHTRPSSSRPRHATTGARLGLNGAPRPPRIPPRSVRPSMGPHAPVVVLAPPWGRTPRPRRPGGRVVSQARHSPPGETPNRASAPVARSAPPPRPPAGQTRPRGLPLKCRARPMGLLAPSRASPRPLWRPHSSPGAAPTPCVALGVPSAPQPRAPAGQAGSGSLR